MQTILRFILFLVYISIYPLCANGETRDIAQARAIAEGKAVSLGVSLSQNAPKKAAPTSSEAGAVTDYYIFNHTNNQGFTIVSGDDCMPEIIGYSTAGTFDENNIPDGLRYYLSAYQETLHHTLAQAESQRISFVPQDNGSRKSAAKSKAVGPLVTTKWAQSWPYNLQCPLYDGTHRAVTGCVATSIAQLMNFYRHPVPQNSGIPGYTTASHLINIEPIFGERRYDWDLLLDTYDENSPKESCDEVAKLMYHCGQSVAMDYADGSGAYTIMAYWALQLYFGFDCEYVYSGDCSRSDWLDLINNEIDNLRPFYIGGNDGLGGHAFLCDGRDIDGLHHINWGWAGYCDGFFNILLLDPWSQTQPGFNNGNEIIINWQLPKGYESYTAYQHLKIQYGSLLDRLPNFFAGDSPGNCSATALGNFKAALEKAEQALEISPDQQTVEGLETLQNDLTRSFARLQNSIVPFDDGYYHILPSLPHSIPMALLDNEGLTYWDQLQENDGRFIWKIKYDADTQSYDVQNIFSNGYISSIERDNPVSVNAYVDPMDYRIAIETADYDQKVGFCYTLRHTNDEGSYVFLNQIDASEDIGNYTVGWKDDDEASHWRLVRVDDALADALLELYAPIKETNALLERLQTISGKSQKLIFKISDDTDSQYDASLLKLSKVVYLSSLLNQCPEYDTEAAVLSAEDYDALDAYCEELLSAYEEAREDIFDVDLLQEFYSEYIQWLDYYSPGSNSGQYDAATVSAFERAMEAVKFGIDNYSLFSRNYLRQLRQNAIDALAAIPPTFHHFSEGYYYISSAQWFDGNELKTIRPSYGNLLWNNQDNENFSTMWKLTYNADEQSYLLTDFEGNELLGGPLLFEGVDYNENGTALAIHRHDAFDDNNWLHLSGYGRGYEESGSICEGLNGHKSSSSLWNLIPVKNSQTPEAQPLQSAIHRLSYNILAPDSYSSTRSSIGTITQMIEEALK